MSEELEGILSRARADGVPELHLKAYARDYFAAEEKKATAAASMNVEEHGAPWNFSKGYVAYEPEQEPKDEISPLLASILPRSSSKINNCSTKKTC